MLLAENCAAKRQRDFTHGIAMVHCSLGDLMPGDSTAGPQSTPPFLDTKAKKIHLNLGTTNDEKNLVKDNPGK